MPGSLRRFAGDSPFRLPPATSSSSVFEDTADFALFFDAGDFHVVAVVAEAAADVSPEVAGIEADSAPFPRLANLGHLMGQ